MNPSLHQKVLLRRLLARPCALPAAAFFLGLVRYSYRAKELLVCWFFFCWLFGVLALLVLGVVSAWYAGQKLLAFARVAKTLVPKLALGLARLLSEALSGLRIVIAGAHKPPAGPAVALSALDPSSCLLVAVVPSAETRVQK